MLANVLRSGGGFRRILLHAVLIGTLLGLPWVASEESKMQSCGPPHYCARTDRRIEPYSQRAAALGPAGSIIRDPVFGSRILRVTDEAADPYGRGRSFMTTASAEQNTWSSDSRHFYLLTPSGQVVLYDFDPATMKSHLRGPLPLAWGDPDFSYRQPNILYGARGRNPAFQQYDISSGQVSKLNLFSGCLKLGDSDLAHSVSVSADDQRLSTVVGAHQDKSAYIYVFDRKLGCRWYNTQTGEVGGQWGLKGAISAPDRFSIHSSKMSKSGEFIWIDRGESTVGKHWVVWEVATTNVTACPQQCTGHLAMGYSHIVGPSGENHPLEFVERPLSNVKAVTPVVKNLESPGNARYWYSHHLSWNYIDHSDSTPLCLSTFSVFNPGEPGVALDTNAPWANEILCIEMDGRDSKVWRFAHTYSTAKNGFWSTPRGNVSQDGRFFLFTSDWQDQLGVNPIEKGHYRTDVFLVELK